VLGPNLAAADGGVASSLLDAILKRSSFLRAVVGSLRGEPSLGRPSVRLRRALLQRCPEEGIMVSVRPEEPELIEAAKSLLGKTYDLCRYERRLAKRCDLIVIVPDSPGSFAELGLFSWSKAVCRKSLILFDKRHRDSDSYLMHGPRKASERRGAKVRFVDYATIEEGWQEVESFAEDILAVKMDESTWAKAMAEADARHGSVVSGRDRLLVLAMINTLQPELDEVRRRLPAGFDAERMERTLVALEGKGLIKRLPNDKCVVTLKGRASVGSGALAKRRDISRLLYLFRRSKGGRE
jgi:hypothetical protein